MTTLVTAERKGERGTGVCGCQASREKQKDRKVEQAEMSMRDRNFSLSEIVLRLEGLEQQLELSLTQMGNMKAHSLCTRF